MALPLLCVFPFAQLDAQLFRLPTGNTALFEPGGEERFFAGTPGNTWISGTFGCVRTDGRQFHEGLDILHTNRDKRGEPTDPVMATADGVVVYANGRAALSNYGNYVVLRHSVHGIEIHSLYAHLNTVRAGLEPGVPVKAGDVIATMGRTTNTKTRIAHDRAHVHFELALLLNDHYAEWQQANEPGERNDHGNWNGRNLAGIDPLAILLTQRHAELKFNLAAFIRAQPEICRVFVRATDFPYVRRYRPLVALNPKAEREGIAGYEIALSFSGLPIRLIPRAASEIESTGRIELLSVNEDEQQLASCGHLVTQQSGRWELTRAGRERLDLLIYQGHSSNSR